MTNEQIDKLKGRRLDVAFAKALNVHSTWRYHENLDDAIAVLPAEWGWRAGTCIDVDAKYFATVWPHEVGIAEFEQCEASNPATALCRAALKAKLAAAEPAKRGDPCACGPEHKPDCWNAEPAGITNPPDVFEDELPTVAVAVMDAWSKYCRESPSDLPPLRPVDEAIAKLYPAVQRARGWTYQGDGKWERAAETAGDGQDQGHR